jgi:hypothetical protein
VPHCHYAEEERCRSISVLPAAKTDEKSLPGDLTGYSQKSRYYTTEEIEIVESQAEDILQKIRDRNMDVHGGHQCILQGYGVCAGAGMEMATTIPQVRADSV